MRMNTPVTAFSSNSRSSNSRASSQLDHQFNCAVSMQSCSLALASGSTSQPAEPVSPIADRSELAMRVAKGMVRSRHKKQDGRIVCRLLLDMLSEDSTEQPIVRSNRFWLDKIDTHATSKDSILAEKQFSLSF